MRLYAHPLVLVYRYPHWDHVSTAHVMTKLREEFLSAESKVQVLDFEGSQLSAEGWEQLAQLAESLWKRSD